MSFASIFIPNFMVQAVVRSEPALQNCALAIVEGAASIRTVAGVNELAAKAGIKPGMTKSQAEQFGAMEVRPRSIAQEKSAHAALLDLGWSVSPRMEDAAADNVVLDLAGLTALFGSEENIAGQLAAGAARLGLAAQIATAANIDAAILASRAFAGITVMAAGEEPGTIGKVPVAALAPSPEVFETLERWGVQTCAALAALPVLQLSERLGQEGVRLHALARARSPRAMVLAQPALDFAEEMELEDAVAEIEPLAFLVGRLLDPLCARMAERSLAAGAIRVRFELDSSAEKELRLRDDHSAQEAPTLYERTLSLPVPMRDSKLLLKLLILQWQVDAPAAPILKIALAAEAARPRVSQGGLFSPICPDPEKVELTVARLAKVVGASNLGSPELLDTHRPEGFRMRRFLPPQYSTETRRRIRRDAAGKERQRRILGILPRLEHGPDGRDTSTHPYDLKTAFRVFRPALPAKVEMREGCPVRVVFPGLRGRVVAASGPWRGSGDWWREDAWQNDEWDIEIQMEGSASQWTTPRAGLKGQPLRRVYRVFYDQIRKEWFVRGAYD